MMALMAVEPALVGRGEEIALIDDLLQNVHEHGAALVVRGEPGIGKSALIAATAGHARRRGMQIISTAGVESEAHLPFAGLHRLLRPILGEAGALYAPQREALQAAFGHSDAAQPEMFRIALATLDLLAAAADRVPMLVIAEDAQWLDASTGAVLAFVARRIESDPIVLLEAVRDSSDDGLGYDGLPVLSLGGLDDAAARELLSTHGSELEPGLLDRVLDTAAGNPLALVELPIAWRDAGTRQVQPDRLPLTRRLEHAFAARTAPMADVTRTLLLIAAADDEGVTADVLRATGAVIGHAVGVDALSPAASAGLVDFDEMRVRFRHPLVRSAIYQTAGLAERHAAHAALATVLDSQPDRRAWHRAASTIPPDGEVAGELEAAAERARRRGAASVAVVALERAARFSADSDRRGALLLHAAEIGFELGDHGAVDRLVDQAEQLELGPIERAQLIWLQGVFDEGLTTGASRVSRLIAAADDLAADGHHDLASRLLWNAAVQCWWSDADAATRERIASLAERIGRPDDLRRLATIAFATPESRGATVVGPMRDAETDVGERIGGAWALGMGATAVGLFDLSGRLLGRSTRGLRTQGRLGLLSRALTLQAWSATHRGDLGVGRSAAEEAERLALETGQPLIAAVAGVTQALLAGLRGDIDRAEALAAAGERVATEIDARALSAVVQHALGLAALGAGRYGEAYEHLVRVHDAGDPAHHYFIRCFTVADLAEAAAYNGTAAQASSVVAALEPIARTSGSPSLAAGLACAHVALAPDDEADARLDAAMRATTGWPFLRARALLAHGMRLRRQHRFAESRSPLRTARDTFEAIGTVPWNERARQELRASGETSRRRTPDARDELSPQELQIASMAAEGLTNREIGQRLFLSHRTVSSHLYRIFPKLGITSRGEIRRALKMQSSD
jgi:DNA-binding CsgD family transcriptional regulator